ncbi:glycosyltransferase family 4 protein [Dietzia lutea]|uniref:glycosyltransferase family 4 protein n=1 Tax=Dietzia lutea TaxID=546160 RepID=UPI000D55669B|nr:glycosyltransferase family 4 protein [Dietzia lutea]
MESGTTPKHVWVINHHAVLPSKDGSGARHLRLAELLPRYGWTATLLVASTRHSNGSQALRGWRARKLTVENGVRALWIRSNAYGSSLPLRFLGMFTFTANLLRPSATRGIQQPNIIIGSTVHPIAAWAGYRLSRRHNVPFVYEIRDVWPETLFELGRLGPKSPISRLLTALDKKLISRAALVLSPLPYVDQHLAEMGFPNKPFCWIANGYDSTTDPGELPRSDGRPFTFMYLGAHGRANALEGVLDAFETACTNAPDLDLRLRLVGDGPLKGELKNHARSLAHNERITFEDRIPGSEVICRARQADCLIANLRDLPVYRFGVSLNKYFMYMAAGRPILSASSAPNNPIAEGEAGFVVEASDPNAIARGIESMARLPHEMRAEMAANGRKELESNYAFDVLARKLAAALNELSKTRA